MQSLQSAAASRRSDVVAVLASRRLDERLCTGTLLLPNLVLTARHCLVADPTAVASGDCGIATMSDPDAETRVHVLPGSDVDLVPESSRVVAREYLLQDGEARLCGGDVALLLLDGRVEGDLVEVHPAASRIDPTFTAVGYGLFDGDWGQQRERIDASVVCSGAACDDDRLVDGEFLARAGACEGDSGGPAFDDSGRQFALVSRTTTDCTESVYLDLSEALPWVKEGVRYAAEIGSIDTPEWAASPTKVTPVPTTSPDPDPRARGGCAMSNRVSPPFSALATMLAGLLLSVRRSLRPRRRPVASSAS